MSADLNGPAALILECRWQREKSRRLLAETEFLCAQTRALCAQTLAVVDECRRPAAARRHLERGPCERRA